MNTVDLMRQYSEILKEDISPFNYDEFTQAYMEAMLWSETDDNGDPFDANYDVSDFSEEALAQIRIDAAHFQQAAKLDEIDTFDFVDSTVQEMAGHDFWLTRAGHGSGFWDGEWEDDDGNRLTELSEKFGEQYIYIGEDGELYLQ